MQIVPVLCAFGCSARPPEPAAAPEPVAEAPAPQPESPKFTAPVPPAAVPPAGDQCAEYAASRVASCANGAAPLEQLDEALSRRDASERDRALVALEPCEPFAPGLIRALRAELAPPACSDVVVGDDFQAWETIPKPVQETLLALVYAGYLERLVQKAPRLEPPFTKAEFKDFSKQTLNTWVVDQAQAVYKIAKQGAELTGYAKAIVAVQAGLADMRFVSVVRDVPLPEDMAHDDELREAYYSELDIALTPWKDRGRDAALVGLREFAELGVLSDPRVERARALLSQLYGGRRIDRLDGLMLPRLPEPTSETAKLRLVAALPSFFVPYVLPDLDPADEQVLAVLVERGVPPGVRADLESRELSPLARSRLARVLVDLGRRYWRSKDFTAAARVLGKGAKLTEDEALLAQGLAEALKGGPRDAAEMMLKGPLLPAGVGNVKALDELANARGPLAGFAAFDAAYILELVPQKGDAEYWRDVAARYDRAAKLLADDAAKARARNRAATARETAKAIAR